MGFKSNWVSKRQHFPRWKQRQRREDGVTPVVVTRSTNNARWHAIAGWAGVVFGLLAAVLLRWWWGV